MGAMLGSMPELRLRNSKEQSKAGTGRALHMPRITAEWHKSPAAVSLDMSYSRHGVRARTYGVPHVDGIVERYKQPP